MTEVIVAALASGFLFLGGMLGSFTRLLFQRQHDWKKDLKRALVLGIVAALLAVPLALFGLLSALSSIFPEGLLEALSALPSENHLAMFFIGLVAGLALEPLLAFFTRLRSQGSQDTQDNPGTEGTQDTEGTQGEGET